MPTPVTTLAAETVYSVVALLAALSMASERLVEIVKGLVPFLETANDKKPVVEGRRKAALQFLAIAAGIFTALLARPALHDFLPDAKWENTATYVGLGLLASGGSGLWNSLLTYVKYVKDAKKKDATK